MVMGLLPTSEYDVSAAWSAKWNYIFIWVNTKEIPEKWKPEA